MAKTILPDLFDYPEESAIIGRLVVGYGELEFALAVYVTCILDSLEDGFRAIFRVKSEGGRIDVADALVRSKVTALGLLKEWDECHQAIGCCKRIRSQYAHSHWSSGLRLYDMETPFKGPNLKDMEYEVIDLELLQKQEAYFVYTLDCFHYVRRETLRLKDQRRRHNLSMPPKMPQPNLCIQ